MKPFSLRPWWRYIKVVASTLAVSLLLFVAALLATGAMIGAAASSALHDYNENGAATIHRPPIPVQNMSVVQEWYYPHDDFFEYFLVSHYRENKALDESAVGNQVFHFSEWGTDGYYLVTEWDASAGKAHLLFVDTTFAHSVALFSSAVTGALTFAVLLGFRLRHRRYALGRDRADEALETSFANASHELKTPLMAIRGYAEGMQEGAVTEDFALPRIIAASDRMAGTVDGILKISRADSGLKQPVLGMWDVREIVYDEVRLVEDACREKGVALDMQLPRPLVRPCDESMTATVIRNVLGNAVRHAESFVRVREGRALKGEIELVVENDGLPPSLDELAHAFERFYKGESGSTGIGLAVSREYAELMGGEITMEVAGQITRLTLRL